MENKEKFELQLARQNLFLIVFEIEEDLETVLEGQPWLFRKNLVIFYCLTKPMERSQIRLNSSPFCIKIGPCLPEFDKKDLLHAIGVTFGGVLRSEINGIMEKIQEINPQKEDENAIVQRVQDNLQSIEVEKVKKMQEEGATVENKVNGKNASCEETLKPIRKISWKRIDSVKVMSHYSE
ncbi:hypothetical protein PVK06_042500 [Gossypium arboreum]|uniref:DUF4283 domain-containing protein n=1 Tax=Gossypium arboreum TaxID=29729 RepID=A0ABR0MKX1_GOSAR|nr:hypothetical protein PVK06_042500 [Gossypium arboreum]